MSQDPVQIVQNLLTAAINRDLETLKAAVAPDIVWWSNYPAHLPFGGEARGAEAAMSMMMHMAEPLELLSNEIHDFVAQGDTVLVTGTEQLRAKATGKFAKNSWALITRLRDGKVASVRIYADSFAVAECLRP